jgi:nucleotide-binding universal stress UspA family protein
MNAKRVLVPVKGDGAGEEAFRLACKLSKQNKAKLYVLYVIEVAQELPLDAAVDPSQGEDILNRIEVLGQDEKYPVEAEYLQARHAGPAIVQEAIARKAELIVMGIPYKNRYGSFTLGETASYILKNSPCPVVLWREQLRASSYSGVSS